MSLILQLVMWPSSFPIVLVFHHPRYGPLPFCCSLSWMVFFIKLVIPCSIPAGSEFLEVFFLLDGWSFPLTTTIGQWAGTPRGPRASLDFACSPLSYGSDPLSSSQCAQSWPVQRPASQTVGFWHEEPKMIWGHSVCILFHTFLSSGRIALSVDLRASQHITVKVLQEGYQM